MLSEIILKTVKYFIVINFKLLYFKELSHLTKCK